MGVNCDLNDKLWGGHYMLIVCEMASMEGLFCDACCVWDSKVRRCVEVRMGLGYVRCGARMSIHHKMRAITDKTCYFTDF